jgi:protein-L-isoaspartate(D-aspartate) O-methyltransferase
MFEQLFARALAQNLREVDVDPRILDAMIAVGRENYVEKAQRMRAYFDSAMPIGHGQTVSQPTFLARVIAAGDVKATDRVLEIGTGSGYAAAVLAALAKEVVTVERIAELAASARARLERDGIENAKVVVGDGFRAKGVEGKFDAIFVMAGAPSIPEAAVARLAPGGRLVVPVGRKSRSSRKAPGVNAKLLRVSVAENGERVVDEICDCSWVPLVGADGFDPEPSTK